MTRSRMVSRVKSTDRQGLALSECAAHCGISTPGRVRCRPWLLLQLDVSMSYCVIQMLKMAPVFLRVFSNYWVGSGQAASRIAYTAHGWCKPWLAYRDAHFRDWEAVSEDASARPQT